MTNRHHEIIIEPTPRPATSSPSWRPTWTASTALHGVILERTKRPLVDAARRLLELGLASADDTMNMRHRNSAHPSFENVRVGFVAGQTVTEGYAGSVRFVKHQPFPGEARAEASTESAMV